MKKFGFTLAEVLITLAVIGVVAVLTLPALMNNVGEQQYISGLKKCINTLSEAGQMAEALDGYNYDDLTLQSGTTMSEQKIASGSLYNILNKRVQIDIDTTDNQGTNINLDNTDNKIIGSGNFAIFMRDGSILQFRQNNVNTFETEFQTDGHIKGLKAVIDVNGVKGPNDISACGQVTNGVDQPCTTQNKKIKDQFPILIRGNFAIPNNNAARYAIQH